MTTAPPTTRTTQQQTAVAIREEPTLSTFQVIERVIAAGDLAGMKPQERVDFYWRTCESLGLNPLSRPFEFINLNGKLTMYARKDATDQLRRINRVTVTGIRRDKDDELGLVTVYATVRDGDGREDESSGIVNIKGLSGEALANALMKAETKAKRRATLSLVGLGFLDESEIEGADRVDVDPTTGEIAPKAKPASLLDAVKAQQAAMATHTTDIPTSTTQAPPDNATSTVDATTPPDEVEGEVREVEEPSAFDNAPAAASDLLERLRDLAEEHASTAAATPEQIAAVRASAFADWPSALINAGIEAAFGSKAKGRPTAGQVRAIEVAADNLGPEAFREQWSAMVAGAQA